MNAITTIEGSLPAPNDLITVAPDAYVATVFAPYATELAHAKVAADNVAFDITTTAGFELAIEQRAIFRNLRINAEATRKERKDPFLKFGKLIDAKYKELAEDIAPYEDRFDALVKAEEARKEAAKQAKVQAELDRVDAIHRNIAAIRGAVAMAAGQPVVMVQSIIAKLELASIDDRYGEFIAMAQTAKDEALAALQTVLAKAKQDEADRAELAALRREKAAANKAAPSNNREAVAQAAGDAIAKARATAAGAPDVPVATPQEALTSALLACHAVLTGQSTDHVGAIHQAELALLAVGITPEALGLTKE